MTVSKSALLKGAMVATIAAATLAATGAAAKSYVVCNSWGECWRAHEHYNKYPSDAGVVYHDDAWWAAHEHDADTHWRLMPDPKDDHGWYDRDGNWHSFTEAPPP